jgi:hypothetical protein
MTLRLGNRVRITNTAPGSGNFTDQNAVIGYTLFGAIPNIVNGDTVPYAAWDGAASWEEGYVTYNAGSPATLSRTVVRSTNSNLAVVFSGNVFIYCTLTAESAIVADQSGNVTLPGALLGNVLMQGQSSAVTSVNANNASTPLTLSPNAVFDVAATLSTTFTFASCPNNAGYMYQFIVRFKQDATGGRVPTFPAAVKWPGGTQPTETATANNCTIYGFMTFNGGTSYEGFVISPNTAT